MLFRSIDPSKNKNIALRTALESKKIEADDNKTNINEIINGCLKAYNKVSESKPKQAKNLGYREFLLQAAVLSAISYQDDPFNAYIGTLQNKGIEELNIQIRNMSPAECIARSKLIADIVTLEHFSKQYKREVKKVLAKNNLEDGLFGLSEIFEKYKKPVDMISTSETNVSMSVDSRENVNKIVKELEGITRIKVHDSKSIVYVVGASMKHKIGIVKKEAREAKHFIRMVAVAVPELKNDAISLWQEAKELNLIFNSIYK